MRAALDPELYRRIKLRVYREQVANSVYAVETGNDPSVNAGASIHNSPNIVGVVAFSQIKIATVCFDPIPAPNIELCRMAELSVTRTFPVAGVERCGLREIACKLPLMDAPLPKQATFVRRWQHLGYGTAQDVTNSAISDRLIASDHHRALALLDCNLAK